MDEVFRAQKRLAEYRFTGHLVVRHHKSHVVQRLQREWTKELRHNTEGSDKVDELASMGADIDKGLTAELLARERCVMKENK